MPKRRRVVAAPLSKTISVVVVVVVDTIGQSAIAIAITAAADAAGVAIFSADALLRRPSCLPIDDATHTHTRAKRNALNRIANLRSWV